jgi:hypothetical protein
MPDLDRRGELSWVAGIVSVRWYRHLAVRNGRDAELDCMAHGVILPLSIAPYRVQQAAQSFLLIPVLLIPAGTPLAVSAREDAEANRILPPDSSARIRAGARNRIRNRSNASRLRQAVKSTTSVARWTFFRRLSHSCALRAVASGRPDQLGIDWLLTLLAQTAGFAPVDCD